MAVPTTKQAITTIMNIATTLGGMDNKNTSFFNKVLIGLMLILLLICALVYMLLSPFFLFFGDSNVSDFRDKYQSSIIQYITTEQIGIYPLPSTTDYITSDYGSRDNPFGEDSTENHSGIDFGTVHHSSLVAIAEGTVHKVGTDKTYGKNVLIRHETEEETFFTFYAHLSQIYVIRGQEVAPYQVIGKEGGDPKTDPTPGRSTGHHLHFEIRETPTARSHIDPYPYILEPPPPPSEDGESSEVNNKEEEMYIWKY